MKLKMPMQKFSTLIYCINRIQSEVDYSSGPKPEKKVDLFEAKKMGPSEKSIRNILNFARSYDVLETESAGSIEMILN